VVPAVSAMNAIACNALQCQHLTVVTSTCLLPFSFDCCTGRSAESTCNRTFKLVADALD
jgi:hypothetical protein